MCQNQTQYPLFAREVVGERSRPMAEFRAAVRRWYDTNPEPRYVAQVQTTVAIRFFDLLDQRDRRELGLAPLW